MLKYSTFFIVTLFISILPMCKSPNSKSETKGKNEIKTDYPNKIDVSQLKQTDFVVTLENNISANKNYIYASSFLYAWDTIKKILKSPVSLSSKNSNEFKLINTTKSYLNTLDRNEYSVFVNVEFPKITAKAFFSFNLPFTYKYQKVSDIIFKNTKTKAFGMEGLDEVTASFTQILYYKDNDHFLIRILPKDSSHEIYLLEDPFKPKTFVDVILQIEKLINYGIKEQKVEDSYWKYNFNEEDVLAIPVVEFNIEKNYESIKNQIFVANNLKYTVAKAYQQTAFVLNENGATIESEAEASVMALDTFVPPPKRLIFDKPFFIIIKKQNASNPYFAAKIENSELLKKDNPN